MSSEVVVDVNNSLDIYQKSITRSTGSSVVVPPPPSSSESFATDPCCTPIRQQKIWMLTNGIIWLFVAIVSLPLLAKKESNIKHFYDKSQCCYCLWVAYNNDTRIEWSTCHSIHHLNYNNFHQVCNINDKNYCGNHTNSDSMEGTLSVETARFIPKYYIYYGLLAFALVSIYLSLLLITTYKYRLLLSGKLFIGNVIVSIICFYPYIKLYQFHRNEFDVCSEPPPFQSGQSGHCYESAIDPVSNTLLNSLAYYLEVYMIYLVYAVYPCICVLIIKCCHKLKACQRFGSIFDNVFFYISVIAAPIFSILSFVILIYYVVIFDADFGLVGFAADKTEQTFIITVGILLLFTTFNMFLMGYCQKQTKDIMCCKDTQQQHRMTYVSLMHQPFNINN